MVLNETIKSLRNYKDVLVRKKKAVDKPKFLLSIAIFIFKTRKQFLRRLSHHLQSTNKSTLQIHYNHITLRSNSAKNSPSVQNSTLIILHFISFASLILSCFTLFSNTKLKSTNMRTFNQISHNISCFRWEFKKKKKKKILEISFFFPF